MESSGIKVICIFQSPPEIMKQFVMRTNQPTFIMLSDPKKKVYQQYHLQSSTIGTIAVILRATFNGTMRKANDVGISPSMKPPKESGLTQLPAGFLIDDEGKIVDLFYAQRADEHIPFKNIEAFIPLENRCKCHSSDCLSSTCRKENEETKRDFGDIFMG